MAPRKKRSLEEIAREFQRGMDKLDQCGRCGKPRMTVSVSFGGGAEHVVTSSKCECVDGGTESKRAR